MIKKCALIVVDVQNDFLPGGSLPVPLGHDILPNVNRLVKLPFDVIVASRDFHPLKHVSFASTWGKEQYAHVEVDGIDQILWPDHCVQGTKGSEFPEGLDTTHFNKIVLKGTDLKIDSYSTFFDNEKLRSTGLEAYLRQNEIEELYFAGLATDYCVLYSIRDAKELGFVTYVIADACKGVDLKPGDVEWAYQEMLQKGVHVLTTQEVEEKFKDV